MSPLPTREIALNSSGTGRLLKAGKRDHGGGLDAAVQRFGGVRSGWIDLSTGINPHAYPVPNIDHASWCDLPDEGAQMALVAAARSFWNVPDNAAVLAAPGASCLIAAIPRLSAKQQFFIPEPTYNEHRAAFVEHGWQLSDALQARATVVVHPNNPDGEMWTQDTLPTGPKTQITIIDESFCDIAPDRSLVATADTPGRIILKSFGKFWGLAGLRLGFAIGDPALIERLQASLGPWPVSGPALSVGTKALNDAVWVENTRARLSADSERLDALMINAGAKIEGGTTLFRLYTVDDAEVWQNRLAQHRIWSRVFPYNPHWLRLGLPHHDHWARVASALA